MSNKQMKFADFYCPEKRCANDSHLSNSIPLNGIQNVNHDIKVPLR